MTGDRQSGALELRSIVAGYAGAAVLRGDSMIAPAGCITAVIGPNGAGKTTLLNVASGSLRPTSGSVVIDGHDVTSLEPHRRVGRGVCHIPEGRAVFQTISVRDNLELFGGQRGRGATDKAIEVFPQLKSKLRHNAGSLSGGQQQMLALARAFVSDPRYILLDEVSMGLAPALVGEIFESLPRLSANGAGVVLVEQYVHKALDVADVVYVLRKGEIVFAGLPSELDADTLAAEYLSGEKPSTQGGPTT